MVSLLIVASGTVSLSRSDCGPGHGFFVSAKRDWVIPHTMHLIRRRANCGRQRADPFGLLSPTLFISVLMRAD